MKRHRGFVRAIAATITASLMLTSAVVAQNQLREPVYRVAKNPNRPAAPASSANQLDKVLAFAENGLRHIRSDIHDYRCKLVKRERINGKLGPMETMYCKIRNRKVVNGRTVTPFSVYMYFLKPNKGREVLFVEGQNNDKLYAREGGVRGRFLPAVWLKPDSALAMQGQRYPLTEIGIENLIVKLLEKGHYDRRHHDTKVVFRHGAKLQGRKCSVIQVTHPVKRPGMDFHIAQIFIDEQLNIPVRYAAYSWPKGPNMPPVLEEEYTYIDIEVNVGLKNVDFDQKNENYNFIRKK